MGVAYAICLATLLASTLCGQAVLRLVHGRAWAWTSPAAGFALLIVVATATIRLPGHGITAAASLGLVVVASAILVRGRETLRLLEAVPSVLSVLCLVSLPFISNGRLGILGVSIDNDLAPHFAWSDALRVGNNDLLSTIIKGYPVGPHSLAAGLGELFATNASVSITALLLMSPVLAGVTAFGALPDLQWPLRFAGSLAVALPYLAIGYFAEGAFKEPLLSMLILAFTLVLRDLALGLATRGEAVVLGVIAAAAVEVYGFPALAPLLAATAFGLILLQLLSLRRPQLQTLKRAGATALVAAGVALVALLPQADRIFEFSPIEAASPDKSNPFGGNFVAEISGFQVFGLWPSSDFRLPPTNLFRAGELAAFATAVALYGAFWWLRRRDPFLPAAALGCLLLYVYVHHREVPYISTKTLALGTVTVAALATFPLLAEVGKRNAGLASRLLHGAVGLAFVALALWSSSMELRQAEVGPLTHANELRSLNGLVRGRPTLFLGHDDFVPWELDRAKFAYAFEYAIGSLVPVEYRPEKPAVYAAPLDFDSVTPSSLDRFDFVVAPRTAFASSAPSNWRMVVEGRWFTVWRRSGATPDRKVLDTPGSPGVVLDCTTQAGKSLRRLTGMAAVRPSPVILPAAGWTFASGAHPQPDEVGFAAVPAGQEIEQTTTIPPGRWEVSLQYASQVPVVVSSKHWTTTLPANLDRKGPYWHVTEIAGDVRQLEISIAAKGASRLASRYAFIGTLALTRTDRRQSLVPLAQACGRYVDWYVLR